MFIASWKEVLKGLGVRGKRAAPFSRKIGRRMTGSAASFSKCKLYVASLLASWREEKGLGVWGKGGSTILPGRRKADSQGCSKGGLKMRSKKVSKKWFQRVPKWNPKVDQNRQKGCSGGVPKRDLKKVPSPGPGKVRFCYEKRYMFVVPFWS